MSERAESILDEQSRTVLPETVRRALSLRPGDALVYEVIGDWVVLRPSRRAAMAHRLELDHVFSDWSDPADDAAFAYLSERSTGG